MTKVYVLIYAYQGDVEIEGVITNPKVADKWKNKDKFHFIESCELNDPELLNRIAKESEIKK